MQTGWQRDDIESVWVYLRRVRAIVQRIMRVDADMDGTG